MTPNELIVGCVYRLTNGRAVKYRGSVVLDNGEVVYDFGVIRLTREDLQFLLP